MSTCTMFASFTYSLSRYLISGDPDLVAQVNASLAPPPPAPATKQHKSNKSSSSTPIVPPPQSANSKQPPQVTYDPHRVTKMFDMLAKYEENFTRHLKILLDTLNYLAATETVVFLSLCARLSSAGEGLDGFEMGGGAGGVGGV